MFPTSCNTHNAKELTTTTYCKTPQHSAIHPSHEIGLSLGQNEPEKVGYTLFPKFPSKHMENTKNTLFSR